MFKWLRRKAEQRSGFGDAVIAYAESVAESATADVASTAAVETAAGFISRSLAMARIEAPDWAESALSPSFMALAGREMVRTGEAAFFIRVGRDGMLHLDPISDLHFVSGGVDPDTWRARASFYGPHMHVSREVSRSEILLFQWGVRPSAVYRGRAAMHFAGTAARLQSGIERSLADETKAAVGAVLPMPEEMAATDENDPLAEVGRTIHSKRGQTHVVPSVRSAGPVGAPASDWKQMRLGPEPPSGNVALYNSVFSNTLAAFGFPPSFARGEGAGLREAMRYLHLTVLEPLVRCIEAEMRDRIDRSVNVHLPQHGADLEGRSRALKTATDSLIAAKDAGVDLTAAQELIGFNLDG